MTSSTSLPSSSLIRRAAPSASASTPTAGTLERACHGGGGREKGPGGGGRKRSRARCAAGRPSKRPPFRQTGAYVHINSKGRYTGSVLPTRRRHGKWPPGRAKFTRPRPAVPPSELTRVAPTATICPLPILRIERVAKQRTRAENAGNVGSRRLGDSTKLGEQIGSSGLHIVFLKDI